MIEEKYVPFEIARLLREKGFDEPCFGAYTETNHDITMFNGKIKNSEYGNALYTAPTLYMTMEWLRIEHNLFIDIRAGETNQKTWYDFDIIPINGKEIDWETFDDIPFIECEVPEEAIKIAIKYCLENLI